MKADVILRLETRSEPVVEEIAYVHAVILGRSGLEEFNKLEQTDWVRYTIQTVELQELLRNSLGLSGGVWLMCTVV